MLKNRKKANAVKLSGIALLAVAVSGIGGTGAVIQHRLAVKNTLKTPTVEVGIIDTVGGKGTRKQKEVSFKNEGTADAFIRVAYAEQWEQGKELLSSQDADGKDLVDKFNGEKFNDSMAEMFSKDLWTLGSDGWYYYNHVLKAGTSTDTLLTAVDFSDFAGENGVITDESLQKYQNADYELHFQVEAVQASDDYELNVEAVDTVFGSEVRLNETQPDNWETNKYTSQLEWVEGGN